MPEEITVEMIKEAVNRVKTEITKVKSRIRLATGKVRDILEDLDAISSYMDEQTLLVPSLDLYNAIVGLIPRVRPYATNARDIIRTLETLSDGLEELIP